MIREPGGRDWRLSAVCASVDPEIFFPLDTGPGNTARTEQAKRICAGCPVREVCLDDVLAWEDPARRWGVVGGLAATERAELFARNRAEVARLTVPVPVLRGVAGGEAA